MSNKIYSIVIIFAGLLLTVIGAKVSTDTLAELKQVKSNIVYLIEQGNYDQAQEQTQKVLFEFSENPALPATLYEIAHEYQRATKYEQVNDLYQHIIQNYPDSPYLSANNARLS
jgi:TolA-binding protein